MKKEKNNRVVKMRKNWENYGASINTNDNSECANDSYKESALSVDEFFDDKEIDKMKRIWGNIVEYSVTPIDKSTQSLEVVLQNCLWQMRPKCCIGKKNGDYQILESYLEKYKGSAVEIWMKRKEFVIRAINFGDDAFEIK